jgi:hypothetical protein
MLEEIRESFDKEMKNSCGIVGIVRAIISLAMI